MIFKKERYRDARAILFACFLGVVGFKAQAQTTDVKALQVALQKSKPDSNRLSILLNLCSHYNNLPKPAAYINRAMSYAGAAQTLSTALNNNRGLGNSYVAFSKAWRNKKNQIQATAYLLLAKNLFIANHFYKEAAEAVLNTEELYQYFGGRELNVRIAYYQQALVLFKQSNARDREEATLKVLGDFYYVKAAYLESLAYLKQALPLLKYVKTIDKESLYDLLGSVYSTIGSLDKGLEYGLLAIKMTEEGKDTTMQACAVYNRVGITYYNMKQYDRARIFYQKALGIAVKNKDIQTQLSLYVNISSALITGGRNLNCIDMLKKVEREYTTAQLSQNMGVYYALIKVYTKLKRFDEAKVYLNRVENFSHTIEQNENSQLQIQSVLAEYYVATLQDQPARAHLAFFKKLAVAHHNPVALSHAYRREAELDSAENKHASAYKNYRISGMIKDSLYSERKSKQIAYLQIQFETEKKDQQLKANKNRIKLLNNQARLEQLNLNQEKTTQRLIIIGAVLLLVLLGLSYHAYRVKQQINRRLLAQSKEIEDKNESLTDLVQQKDSLLEEKEWLMKEIHHRVKNNLQIVISLLSTQSNYLDNEIAYNAIRESQHRMQSISLIHQKLYQSENLAFVEINAYISDLVAYLSDSFDTGSRIAFQMDLAHIELDVTRAVPLGLILNEAITNSIKYAFPDQRKGNISITLKATDENTFVLRMHDDGVGMPATADVIKGKSLGMSLIRGLSKQMGGRLSIENLNGITVAVEFIHEVHLREV